MFACRIYPIIDTLGQPGRSHLDIALAVLAAGIPLLQLRVKDQPTRAFVDLARRIQQAAVAAGASLIINDRADIAKLVGAAGVHLGQDDLLPADAREILGPQAIIGFSTHNVAQAAAAAAAGGISYIGFGPIFATTSKQNPDPLVGLEGLQRARAAVGVPIVAIGGITASNLPAVLQAGADAVAMIGEIARAADITARITQMLKLV